MALSRFSCSSCSPIPFPCPAISHSPGNAPKCPRLRTAGLTLLLPPWENKRLNEAASLVTNELLPSLQRRAVPGWLLSLLSESSTAVTALPAFHAAGPGEGRGTRASLPVFMDLSVLCFGILFVLKIINISKPQLCPLTTSTSISLRGGRCPQPVTPYGSHQEHP